MFTNYEQCSINIKQNFQISVFFFIIKVTHLLIRYEILIIIIKTKHKMTKIFSLRDHRNCDLRFQFSRFDETRKNCLVSYISEKKI